MHRACGMRSGKYLAKYLIHCNRSVDANRLLARCSIHDNSKIRDTAEFLSLASIVDEMDSLHDISHVLSDSQTNAIKLHWKKNSHHPEFYKNSNDMSELDILEMACDCHARSKQYKTDLIEFITTQQDLRFHFDIRHFYMLKRYCTVLVELTKDDDYSVIFNDDYNISFNFKDSTMRQLEAFDDSCYVDCISTDRVYMSKEETADFASVAYSIFLKENNAKIGNISIKFNGYMELNMFQEYVDYDYGEEALAKVVEVANNNALYIVLRKDDEKTIKMLEKIGFVALDSSTETIKFKYTKEEKVYNKQ
jgi:hypothetical protein